MMTSRWRADVQYVAFHVKVTRCLAATYPTTLGGGIPGLVLMSLLFSAVNLISNGARALLGQRRSPDPNRGRAKKSQPDSQRSLLLSVVMLFL